ncbi:MAG: hypothetical protein WCX48_04915 [Bacteroidales bacterium]
MYKIAIPLTGQSKMVVFPNDPNIAIFSATLSQDEIGTFIPAMENRTIPK